MFRLCFKFVSRICHSVGQFPHAGRKIFVRTEATLSFFNDIALAIGMRRAQLRTNFP
jgi:hypothetical protein